jgi:TonB family protein
MTTMIADPPSKTTRLGVGFDAHRGEAQNREAWKTAIGTKRVPARLEMLPEGESRMGRVGISALFQTALLIFFVALPIFFPERMKTVVNAAFIPLAMPVTEVPVAAPPPPPPKINKVVQPKPPVEEVKLNPKQPHIFVTQKVLQPKIQHVDTKAPELKPDPVLEAKLETTTNQPKRPREEVKMNNLSDGSAAAPTVNLPLNKVQTGGFGDPNGLPGKGDPNKTTNINRLGSPALPGGNGYGNGTGGDKGVRGVVASTGFGNGVANPPDNAKHGTVQTAGFADQSVVTDTPKKKAASGDSGTSAVDILDKPRPEYTAEGRSLRLEGDVVLDVVFRANGTVQVNRIVSGLGHGLDEAAGRAAQQIRFKPARQDGQPVDFPARVRIEFRLAY